jgi:hypothetical protein
MLDQLQQGDISGAVNKSLEDLQQFGDKYTSAANQALKKTFGWCGVRECR